MARNVLHKKVPVAGILAADIAVFVLQFFQAEIQKQVSMTGLTQRLSL